jgi:hypothetical protein
MYQHPLATYKHDFNGAMQVTMNSWAIASELCTGYFTDENLDSRNELWFLLSESSTGVIAIKHLIRRIKITKHLGCLKQLQCILAEVLEDMEPDELKRFTTKIIDIMEGDEEGYDEGQDYDDDDYQPHF